LKHIKCAIIQVHIDHLAELFQHGCWTLAHHTTVIVLAIHAVMSHAVVSIVHGLFGEHSNHSFWNDESSDEFLNLISSISTFTLKVFNNLSNSHITDFFNGHSFWYELLKLIKHSLSIDKFTSIFLDSFPNLSDF
jgi:hypothetical protein